MNSVRAEKRIGTGGIYSVVSVVPYVTRTQRSTPKIAEYLSPPFSPFPFSPRRPTFGILLRFPCAGQGRLKKEGSTGIRLTRGDYYEYPTVEIRK